MYRKIVVIINGSGEKGKDSLIDFFSEKYLTVNISSIQPYKNIAYDIGWDGKKDEKGRKLLSELKRVSIEYNDYPTDYVIKEYRRFAISNNTVLFIHAREPEEIEKYRKSIKNIHPNINVVTLKIDRTGMNKFYGNRSDDGVDAFEYDHTYYNDTLLEDAGKAFITFMETFVLDMDSIQGIVTPEDVHRNPDKYAIPPYIKIPK